MNSATETRPWGSFVTFVKNEPCTVKLIYVNKGESLSLQYHLNRQEFWRVVEGNPELTIGEDTHNPTVGDEFVVASAIHHRIAAPINDVIILEISTGEFDEDDIVRVEDKYGRV